MKRPSIVKSLTNAMMVNNTNMADVIAVKNLSVITLNVYVEFLFVLSQQSFTVGQSVVTSIDSPCYLSDVVLVCIFIESPCPPVP